MTSRAKQSNAKQDNSRHSKSNDFLNGDTGRVSNCFPPCVSPQCHQSSYTTTTAEFDRPASWMELPHISLAEKQDRATQRNEPPGRRRHTIDQKSETQRQGLP